MRTFVVALLAFAAAFAIAVMVVGPSIAHAEVPLGNCKTQLADRKVSFRPAARAGVANAVEITGPLGGVTITGDEPFVIDCSLAISLDEAGRYFTHLGIDHVRTSVPSKPSSGLAVDVSSVTGEALGTLRIARDYQAGLGDEMDCVGSPSTKSAETLKVLQCQLVRSGLFQRVLSPDYDDAHRDHFHLEAVPWRGRAALRSATVAIH